MGEINEKFIRVFLPTERKERNSNNLTALRLEQFIEDGVEEEEALLDMVNKIEELIPISAKREYNEMIKCDHLITATENF